MLRKLNYKTHVQRIFLVPIDLFGLPISIHYRSLLGFRLFLCFHTAQF